MTDHPRRHARADLHVEVEFRTTGAFLVAYSANLSKGGLFLEMNPPLEVGTPIALRFKVPNQVGPIQVSGRVAWVRETPSAGHPIGVGIEFSGVDPSIGQAIDRIVATFHGIRIALLVEHRDRAALTRIVKSALTCTLVELGDPDDTRKVFENPPELLVAVVPADDEEALQVIRLAHAKPLPVVALVHGPGARELALAAGADVVLDYPPTLHDLQSAVIRLIGRPAAIR